MPAPERRLRRRGAALVLALWLALLLGVAGIAVVRLAATGAGEARVEVDLAAARAAAEGGVWAAAHQLAAMGREQRPPLHGLDLRIGAAMVAVRAEDEDGRPDLNAAPEPLLAALFRLAGLPAEAATDSALRLVAWREASEPGGQRHRLRLVSELDAVPGVPPGLAEAVRDLATTHTGRAAPAPEAAPAALRDLLAPQGAPMRPGLRTPQRAGTASSGRRQVWRILAEARQGAVTARIAAVLDLTPGDGMPGRVLEWQAFAR
ncbi:hypothetical protein [Paracraurococcus ruber]|uniref:General secretion pathway protein GspK n=1 Tax=Paracraurococcus ruber TaxID=77675 RepID=A0ABS1D1B3_9PROT|nr:hypothetical protein [Paracraurococcus ruber]MBK1660395.1 hypothetical protein [Paracraurococcus ruber]